MAMSCRPSLSLVLLHCLRCSVATPWGTAFLHQKVASETATPLTGGAGSPEDNRSAYTLLDGKDGKGSTDDPWSAFANKWSPEVQARINALKEEVQNATQAASRARRREKEEAKELAEERQIATAEAPSARTWEARITQAQRGWEAAVVFLMFAVAGVYYLGHHRGAWGLNPMTLGEPLLPKTGNGQAPEDGAEQEKLRAEVAQLQEAATKARAQELSAKRALQELQGQHAQLQAQLADAKLQDAAMRKALKEMQTQVDANAVNAESQGQDAVAMRQMQEVQGQLQSEVAEARAQEAAARKALHDVRVQAEADVKRVEKVMQEMHDELLFLRSRVGGMPMPPATPPIVAPPLGLPLVAPLPMATAPPDLNPKLPELSPRGMPMRALSPAMMRPTSPPPHHTMNVRAPSPAGITSPGTSASTFALNSPTSSQGHRGTTPQQQRLPHRATASNPPGRFHLVAETSSCPGMAGGFGVGGAP